MRVLLVALISEGLLFVVATLLTQALHLELVWGISSTAAMSGVGLALPPLLLNTIMWERTRRRPDSPYARFSREIIVPLCKHVSIPVAGSIAILSGWCEEYFFRGALSASIALYMGPLPACLISSFLFAAIHFIGSFKRFGAMLPLYMLMGIYIWSAHNLSGSLFCVAVLHGFYNFMAILQVKHRVRTVA